MKTCPSPRLLNIFLINLLYFPAVLIAGESDVASEKIENSSNPVEIEWDAVPNASSYEVEFTDSTSKIQVLKTPTNSIASPLECGSYTIRARSFDNKNFGGVWSEVKPIDVPLRQSKMTYPNAESSFQATEHAKVHKVELKWDALEEGVRYRVEILNEKKERISVHETNESSLTLDLPVGAKYFWHVESTKSGCKADPTVDYIGFEIVGILDVPNVSLDVRDINWTVSDGAETFDYVLENETVDSVTGQKQWSSIISNTGQSSNQVTLARDASFGRYRFSVVAKGHHFLSSAPGVLIFNYNEPPSFPRHLELALYGISSGLNLNVFRFSGAAYSEVFGGILSYEQGARSTSFVNATNQSEENQKMAYSKVAIGPAMNVLLDRGAFFSLRATYNREVIKAFEVYSASQEHTSFSLEGGPYFESGAYKFIFNISREFLIISHPIKVNKYLHFAGGTSLERQITDYFSCGLIYYYESLNYQYMNRTDVLSFYSFDDHHFGLSIKWIVH